MGLGPKCWWLELVPAFHLKNLACKGEGVSSNVKKVKSTNLCLSSSKVFTTVVKGELWQVQKFQTGVGLSKEKLQVLKVISITSPWGSKATCSFQLAIAKSSLLLPPVRQSLQDTLLAHSMTQENCLHFTPPATVWLHSTIYFMLLL